MKAIAKLRHQPTQVSQRAAASPVSPVRSISPLLRVILFVRAGGRCEFDGCNEYLFEHHVTLKEGNFAAVAHIVAFRPDGPRGHAGKRPSGINDVNNLMVLCPRCHKLVDDHPAQYTKRTLQEYKERHERHIRHMTGLSRNLKTSILVFTSKVSEQDVFISFEQILEAVSPRYPVSRPGKIIDLAAIHIGDASSIKTAQEAIKRGTAQLYDAGGDTQTVKHLSVFALAPIPLLIDLGARLSNKIPTDLFQRHRDKENWTWKRSGDPVRYQFKRLRHGTGRRNVAMIVSLSGTIRPRDLPKEIDRGYSIYELTLKRRTPNPTFLRTKHDLENFRLAYQAALATIMRDHGTIKSLRFFPAVPAPIAILCGRELLPKVHPELLVYDFDKQKVGFTYQLKVNNHEH
jgi:hypothetical protein